MQENTWSSKVLTQDISHLSLTPHFSTFHQPFPNITPRRQTSGPVSPPCCGASIVYPADSSLLLTMCHTKSYTCRTCKYFYQKIELCNYCSRWNLEAETCTRRLGVFSWRKHYRVRDGFRDHCCYYFHGVRYVRASVEMRCELTYSEWYGWIVRLTLIESWGMEIYWERRRGSWLSGSLRARWSRRVCDVLRWFSISLFGVWSRKGLKEKSLRCGDELVKSFWLSQTKTIHPSLSRDPAHDSYPEVRTNYIPQRYTFYYQCDLIWNIPR